MKKNDKKYDFSIAQIISEKENKNMPDKTGMDEKLSDLVGTAKFEFSDKLNLKYNFSYRSKLSKI